MRGRDGAGQRTPLWPILKPIARIPSQNRICAIDLVRIDPATNCFRFHRLAVWPDLFGGVSLNREWGRIGQPGKLRLDPHPDAESAEGDLTNTWTSSRRAENEDEHS